jgi:hypothetical protein
VTEWIQKGLKGLLGSAGDGMDRKRAGGITGGLQVTEWIKTVWRVTGGYRGQNEYKRSGGVTGVYR